MPVLSVLDLSPITAGASPGQALDNSLRLAQHTEALGYHRYWVAEHHNMPGIASAATAVVIGHIAGGTTKLRVGSGGIMLHKLSSYSCKSTCTKLRHLKFNLEVL
mgnify:CR=1 FL=1